MRISDKIKAWAIITWFILSLAFICCVVVFDADMCGIISLVTGLCSFLLSVRSILKNEELIEKHIHTID